MNNPSPLIPQGSLLEQKNKGRARVKIAVFFVLAIHGIGLLALLMQGCRREEPAPPAPSEATNTAALPAFEATNAPMPDTNAMAAAASTSAAPAEPVSPAAAPAGGTSEYTIAKGDTFSTIATHFHVTVKAIADANPGVEPTRLKIGQKIQIPAPTTVTAAAAAAGGAGGAGVEAGPGEQIYTVKSGDTLSRIATQFGVTVKAIRTANNLKTDSIKVGQKLKIPAKAAGAAPAAPQQPVSTPTAPPAQ